MPISRCHRARMQPRSSRLYSACLQHRRKLRCKDGHSVWHRCRQTGQQRVWISHRKMPVVSVPEKMLIKTGTLTTCRVPIKSLRLAARNVTPAAYDRQFDCPSSQSINLDQFVKNNRPAAANRPGLPEARVVSHTAISMVSTFATINPGETLERANSPSPMSADLYGE